MAAEETATQRCSDRSRKSQAVGLTEPDIYCLRPFACTRPPFSEAIQPECGWVVFYIRAISGLERSIITCNRSGLYCDCSAAGSDSHQRSSSVY